MNRSPVSFKHLVRLTDDTGILEHALGSIPRRKEGYSTDDQARALWVCLEWSDFADGADAEMLQRLTDTYLAFLLWAQGENGHFHNNFAFDRTPENETPSDDCLGRCLWACALAMTKWKEQERQIPAKDLFTKALPQVERLHYPRGWAYALSAFSLSARHSLPFSLAVWIDRLAARLTECYRQHAKQGWHWFEPVLSYSNGVIPWALLWGYEILQREELLTVARDSLDFLIEMSLNEKGQIRPVGNHGWCTPRQRAIWDQQPIDVMKLALAAAKAHELTGEAVYAETVVKCRGWFHGENDSVVVMVNQKEGSCFDGLTKDGPNLNQGAEAVLSYLLTEVIYEKLAYNKRKVKEYAACTRSALSCPGPRIS